MILALVHKLQGALKHPPTHSQPSLMPSDFAVAVVMQTTVKEK